MKGSLLVSVVLGASMALAASLALFMIPTAESVSHQEKIDLESMIPAEFDGWKIEPEMAARIVNPDEKGLVKEIYDQTLSRTYINASGERVMLSIAYGGRQSTDLQVHRPEVCYAASGFRISKISKTYVDTTIGRIPVMRLVAKQGARNEPITYWVRMGDSLTRGWLEQKFAAIGYGLTRKVPDGLLFRVSTISNDEQDSYRIQQDFLVALMKMVKSTDRVWLVGRLGT